MRSIAYNYLESQDIQRISMVTDTLVLDEEVNLQDYNHPIWVNRLNNHCHTGTIAVMTDSGIRIREIDEDKSPIYDVIPMLSLAISLPENSEVWFGGKLFHVTEDGNTAVGDKAIAKLPYFEFKSLLGGVENSIDMWLEAWLLKWQNDDCQTANIANLDCAIRSYSV